MDIDRRLTVIDANENPVSRSGKSWRTDSWVMPHISSVVGTLSLCGYIPVHKLWSRYAWDELPLPSDHAGGLRHTATNIVQVRSARNPGGKTFAPRSESHATTQAVTSVAPLRKLEGSLKSISVYGLQSCTLLRLHHFRATCLVVPKYFVKTHAGCR